ncbi:MAG: WecB/TagA/CpsF family glycosyltransferase [Verrucomicrobiae bacterium]|nr:WecB/TagA/CpsF family glycosyltransferase [Verrucomicrobiae bacterium]
MIAANVHVVMECYDNVTCQEAVNSADLITPDGMPLVWVLRKLGFPEQTRVYGPDLTLWVLAAAAKEGVPVGLYGGLPDTLITLQRVYSKRFPALRIVYAYSPPFRPLSTEEDRAVVRAISDSGCRILLVGLGCPKQELWIARHKGQVPAVMLAVGAAFDFHAGRIPQAPCWMQRLGLEWFFRLLVEPRRLWKRYLKHNPRFVWLVMRQLCGS